MEGDGISMLPALPGRSAEQRRHEYLYWEFYEGGGKQAVVTERWKAIRPNWNDKPDGPLELYDLQADPGEERDLAAAHPEVVQAMQKHLAEAHTAHAGSTNPPAAFSGAKKAQKN